MTDKSARNFRISLADIVKSSNLQTLAKYKDIVNFSKEYLRITNEDFELDNPKIIELVDNYINKHFSINECFLICALKLDKTKHQRLLDLGEDINYTVANLILLECGLNPI